MRGALLSPLLIVGCDKKPEPTKTAPAPASPEVKPAATAAPPQPAVPQAPVAEAAAPEEVNCTAIVTADDVKQACGARVLVQAMSRDQMPKFNVCAYKLTEPNKELPLVQIRVNAFADPAQAQSWTKLGDAEAKAIPGLGDRAWSRIKERPDLKSTEYMVGVQKGSRLLFITSTKNSVIPKLPCTLEQLTALARTAVTRLP
jgi:hypothetical protein